MSEQPSGSGSNPGAGSGSNSTPGPSKAIASLAKKPTETTRQGNKALKFVPTLPARRKKEQSEVKAEPTVHQIPTPARGRGRARGRGDGPSGRGRGRGGAAPVELTASGPFALGPTLAGNSIRRPAPRSNFAMPATSGSREALASLGAGLKPINDLSNGGKKGGKVKDEDEDEVEIYSDPEDGVEIIDMEEVKGMDYMAPESLKKEKSKKKGKKGSMKVKKEGPEVDEDAKSGQASVEEVEISVDEAAARGEVDLANALDLSESEEDEELEDIIEDFALQNTLDEDPELRQERLYFFQFPAPFPEFLPTKNNTNMEVDAQAASGDGASSPSFKKVTFAPDTDIKKKGKEDDTDAKEQDGEGDGGGKLDGLIGQLEIHQSGAVKMRLGNGVLLEVTAATQPSFLQQAVHLDMQEKRMNVLGEVNKRFVVSPDIDFLLAAMESSEGNVPDEMEGLIPMDTE